MFLGILCYPDTCRSEQYHRPLTSRFKYRHSSSGQPASSYPIANTKAVRVTSTSMARQLEQCVGELISMGNGRQLGDRCKNKSYKLWNHLCSHHVDQHDNPRYPTRNSYLRRSDERPAPKVSQTEARPNVLRTGASTPVDTSSRTTASAEPSQSSIPQRQPTSSNPQPQTPPEQPDRRRHATTEPSRRIPLPTPMPIQAPNTGRSARSHNPPTPPTTETQNPSEQPDRRRHVKPEPPEGCLYKTPHPHKVQMLEGTCDLTTSLLLRPADGGYRTMTFVHSITTLPTLQARP